MNGAITYEMLSAVIAALMVVGGAWFFIERRIKEVEKTADYEINKLREDKDFAHNALRAEIALLRETMMTKYVSNEQLVRLEERLVAELREIRRQLTRRARDEE